MYFFPGKPGILVNEDIVRSVYHLIIAHVVSDMYHMQITTENITSLLLSVVNHSIFPLKKPNLLYTEQDVVVIIYLKGKVSTLKKSSRQKICGMAKHHDLPYCHA